MKWVLGIDVGSSFTKAVVLRDGALASHSTISSGGSYSNAARKASDEAIEKAAIRRADISATFATGYGSGTIDFANRTIADISCHAAGIRHLFSTARTVIDIGGQFCRVIRLDNEGRPVNFVQNEKCAGGSGRFLQIIARILHLNLEDIGPLSLEAGNPVQFTTGCAVFAESEAVSRIAEGASPADILAGVHKAMSAKIVNLTVRLGLVQDCAVTGGGAKDEGLVKTLGSELGLNVLVPEEPWITGALGAALLGEAT